MLGRKVHLSNIETELPKPLLARPIDNPSDELVADPATTERWCYPHGDKFGLVVQWRGRCHHARWLEVEEADICHTRVAEAVTPTLFSIVDSTPLRKC
jgi:hypothetical protein